MSSTMLITRYSYYLCDANKGNCDLHSPFTHHRHRHRHRQHHHHHDFHEHKVTLAAFLFLTLLLALSIFLLPSSSQEFSTTVLDVAASLNNNNNYNNLQQQPTPTSSSSSSSSTLTLQLHPRHCLFKPHNNDSHAFLLSQLDRDTARVNSIIAKLNLALANDSGHRPEGLSSPVTSGISQGSGEYFARIGVGQPPQEFYMAVDTGSDISWLQCRPCTRCYPQSGPIFNPWASSSYGTLSCQARECKQQYKPLCSNNRCQYVVYYGDGSFTTGDLVTETVSFGRTGAVNRVTMGCGHDNEGLFVGSAGLLGLGSGPLSLTSQVKATSFSYCLVPRGSDASSTLEFNSPRPGDSITTRMLRNPRGILASFYYAGFTGVRVGGRRVPVPANTFTIDQTGDGGIVVDSGTAVTRLQTRAYFAVRDAFVALTRNYTRAGRAVIFDTCYDFSGMSTVIVPSVSFEADGGRLWRLPAEAYLIPVGRRGVFCFAMAPTMGDLSILGNVQQQGTRVSFDITNSVIGFSPNKC